MSDLLDDSYSHDHEKDLADTLHIGVASLNEAGRLTWWNASAARLLGLRPKHRDKKVAQLLKGTGIRILFSNHIESLSITRKVGRKIWHLELSLKEDNNGGQLLVVRDTTEVERFLNMRKDFIANVSHELRTPLTVFRGYLELMQDGVIGSPSDQALIFDQMNDQCQRMETLVKDLLLLSRLEAGGPDPGTHQLFFPHDLIKEIMNDAKQLSQGQHTFVFDVDESLRLLGEVNELRSAFSNIIINAVRYTPAGGAITISWKKEGDWARFSVQDTGIGISSKHIDKITQRFYRVDQARPNAVIGGTGLGLAIVKHVLVRHDAELQVTSAPNEGSCFSCCFPLESKDADF